MAGKHEKRLFNRYDQYEIASIFTETAEDYLSSKLQGSWRRFMIKLVLGILLLVNGYLSHWGPWPWPSNYYFLAFSVVFYHLGSYLYELASGVKSGETNFVGDFVFGKQLRGVGLRIGEDKQNYFLEVLKSKDSQCSEKINHTDYFTVEGFFLEEKFKQLLEKFVEKAKKGAEQ